MCGESFREEKKDFCKRFPKPRRQFAARQPFSPTGYSHPTTTFSVYCNIWSMSTWFSPFHQHVQGPDQPMFSDSTPTHAGALSIGVHPIVEPPQTDRASQYINFAQTVVIVLFPRCRCYSLLSLQCARLKS